SVHLTAAVQQLAQLYRVKLCQARKLNNCGKWCYTTLTSLCPRPPYLVSMPLHPLVGHADARKRLAHAVQATKLPQVLILSGPPGVGKQRLALWLGQLVLCTDAGSEP